MQVCDIMSRIVLTVSDDATIKIAAETMIRNRVNALPVIDQDFRLLGLITEGDIIQRSANNTDHDSDWWRHLLTSADEQAKAFVRAHATYVKDVMTKDVITAAPDDDISYAATLMHKHHIKSLPVLREDHLAGMLTRADILKLFVRLGDDFDTTHSDSDLKKSIEEYISSEPWSKRPFIVSVESGCVELRGIVFGASEKAAIKVAAEQMPGVKAVIDKLEVRHVEFGS